MTFNHPPIVLWDEMNDLSPEDFPRQFPSALTVQVAERTRDHHHFVASLCHPTLFTYLSEEVALMMLLLSCSLD